MIIRIKTATISNTSQNADVFPPVQEYDDDPAGYMMSKCKTLSKNFGTLTALYVKMFKVSTFLTVKAYLVPFFGSKCGLQYVFCFDLPAKTCSYTLPLRHSVATAFVLQNNFEHLLLKIFHFCSKYPVWTLLADVIR